MEDRDDEDEDWAEETTEEAQRRRMEEISDHAKNLTLSDDLEKPLEERVDLFYNFVKVSSCRLSMVECLQHLWVDSVWWTVSNTELSKGVSGGFKGCRLLDVLW